MTNLRIGLALGALIALVATPAAAQLSNEEKSYQGIQYACTGVSKETRADPRWNRYPLKLMFSSAGGQYVADVQVTIRDAANNPVFEVECLGPWLLVDLAPGSYSVTAVARDSYTQTARVSVGTSGQRALTIRYPEIKP